MKIIRDRFLIAFAFMIVLFACDQRKDLVDKPLYDGPIAVKDTIDQLISDSARVIFRMKASRENSYENGNVEWPGGLYLESFDENKELMTLLTANYVFYDKETNLYRAEGNVIVESIKNGDRLNTEELFWDPQGEFYTEKFVTINSDDEVHTGEGMRANQDFTSYRILKPSGSFMMDEEQATRENEVQEQQKPSKLIQKPTRPPKNMLKPKLQPSKNQ